MIVMDVDASVDRIVVAGEAGRGVGRSVTSFAGESAFYLEDDFSEALADEEVGCIMSG